MYMSEHVRKVYILLKEGDLHTFMSSYLAQRIEGCSTIEVMLGAEITAFEGKDHLETIVVKQQEKKKEERLDISAAFIFIGADPCTAWLPEEIATDKRGYILTGRTAARSPHWNGDRPPFYLETSRPGVFAAGDVRADSVKRVASAVGEGAMAVQFVHEFRKASEEDRSTGD
jgi:thioredoxin reductase (NADPH)